VDLPLSAAGPFVDAKTHELRAVHDVLAEFYADRLAGALDRMPAERAVLGLSCDLTLAAGPGHHGGGYRLRDGAARAVPGCEGPVPTGDRPVTRDDPGSPP
jgi:hypothetical protein